jgi:hypothetical protein
MIALQLHSTESSFLDRRASHSARRSEQSHGVTGGGFSCSSERLRSFGTVTAIGSVALSWPESRLAGELIEAKVSACEAPTTLVPLRRGGMDA